MIVWLVNPFDPLPGESFRPGRYAYMARLLADKGHAVTWWSSNYSHIDKAYRSTLHEGRGSQPNLSVRLLETPPYRSNVSLARLYNHHVYGKRFYAEALECGKIPDIIIASVPPLGSAASAIRAGKRLKAKVIIDIQDLWPDVFFLLAPKALRRAARLALSPWAGMTASIYRGADGLIAVSRDFLDHAVGASGDRDKKALVLHLGIDLALFDGLNNGRSPMDKKKGERWAVYAGSVGRAYDVGTIVECAASFRDTGGIRFIIAGDGMELPRHLARARELELQNVVFTGTLGYADLVRLLHDCDIGLNAYALYAYDPSLPQTFPNKVFDYFAAGLPVVNSIPGELGRVIEEAGAGVRYTAGDVSSLAHAIGKILDDEDAARRMGENARRLAEQRYDRDIEYAGLETFVETIVQG